jgi:uncharacterized damage-inducible protein DinB
MTDLRFPVGQFTWDGESSPARREQFINDIGGLPARLREAVAGLTDEQLDTPYRDGGWTVRQVIHHLADSHLNSYVRFRLALTEETPTIKAYDEAQWAELEDARRAPVEVSLALLESLHDRWVRLLRSLQPGDFARQFNHPERGPISLDANLALYAWHGRHHTAHVTGLREREGWK